MNQYKKVLIISYHFPPLNSMAAKRYGIMCKYFKDYGYEPYVITANARNGCFMASKLDLEIPISRGQITRVGTIGSVYPVHNLALMLMCEWLRSKKWESRAIDLSSIGWYEKVKQKIEFEQYKDIDIIIGTYPIMGNVLLGRYLSKKLKKPFVVEIRDLISDYDENIVNVTRCKRLDRFCEWLLLRKTDGIVTVTRGFKKILKKRYPNIMMATIYNGWDGAPAIRQRTDKKYLYYAGSLYEHRLESLVVLLNAISKIGKEENIEFIIRSEGPRSLDIKVQKIILDMGLDNIVKLLGAEKESVIKKEQSMSYINVVLSTVHRDDIALMTTLPGKVFELINNKPPVLAVVPEEAELAEVLKYTNKGISTINEDEIIEFIKSGGRQYTGNNRIPYFSRKKQAAILCAFLDELLRRRRK